MFEVIVTCLALNIYFEARGEPDTGQFAVAEVTIRRAYKSNRPICYEVFSDSQFSWTARADSSVVRNAKAWAKALSIARQALETPTEFSKGATHFHAKYVKPVWAKRLCHTVTIGTHIFYRECS